MSEILVRPSKWSKHLINIDHKINWIYEVVIRAGKMAELLQLREMAKQMGLQGQEAVVFVREQQEIGREERRLQREHQREEAARQQERR